MSDNLLKKVIPITNWLPQYSKGWLRFDIIAGLTTSAVVIPKAMAYASIAGLPLEVGLYTVFIPLVIYAVLGTSRALSVSTTSMIAILTASAIAQVVPQGDPAQLMAVASTLALLVGIMLLAASILRLGFIANFISDPVLTGFKAGIGVIIVVDQIPKLLGVHFVKGNFIQNLISIVQHLPQTSLITLVFAIIMLVLIIGLERFLPRSPAPLVAVVVGIIGSGLLGLERVGVEIVGSIQPGLPSFAMPDFSLIKLLWPGALGIALMSFVETIAAGRTFTRHGEPRPKANQELLAIGAANFVGSLFHTMPAGGGTSQTAVNRSAGGRTQVAGLVAAVIGITVLLVLAPVFRIMPLATLAAVVIATSIPLISPKEFRSIRRIRHIEFRWAFVALLGVVLLGTLQGIFIAVILSLLSILYHANHPPVYALGRKPHTDVFRPLSDKHPDDETFPGLLIVRTEGRMHFANAQRVGDKVWPMIHEEKPKIIVFDCSVIPDIEYTALKMLINMEEKLREKGIMLWLAALNPEALEVVKKSTLWGTLGTERMFLNVEQAVTAYRRMQDTGYKIQDER